MSEKVYTIEEIQKMLAELLKDKPVYKVILFGSYAKQQANKKSDVDLVIDTNSELKGFALLKLICQIEEKLQKNIDGFEKYEIADDSLIDDEIKKTGVVVYAKYVICKYISESKAIAGSRAYINYRNFTLEVSF